MNYKPTISYIIGNKDNPLYEGNFKVNGKYETFGQHSFLFDLTVDCLRKNIDIKIITDELETFPLLNVFISMGIQICELKSKKIIKSDIIILDTVNMSIFNQISIKGYIIGIIHNHTKSESQHYYDICNKIVCLTAYAKQNQSKYVNSDKIHIITQGIDLNRFALSDNILNNSKNVLIYSRMDSHKGSIYLDIVSRLLAEKYKVSIVGDGDYYKLLQNKYGDQIEVYKHIPCYIIHDFIRNFNLIISNGRGVMEGLASGKPTIAAGVNYCGLIKNDNVEFFFERNFTGSNIKNYSTKFDLNEVFDFPPTYYRNIAERYFDVSVFTSKLIGLTDTQ